MVFWITSRMKATKEQVDEELMVIKLFASNYARDLFVDLGFGSRSVFIGIKVQIN